MPTNCCVPLCTKKDKRDKETGEKISFFRFPEDEDLMKQWIHAIRRDVGPYFSVNEGTRVCSRHFKAEDLRKSLNGRVSPRPGAVPSIFAWKRSSPRKRAPPTPRFTATTVAKDLTSEAGEVTDSAAESCEIGTSTNMAADLAFPETAEMQNTTPKHFVEKSEKDLLIAELEDKHSAALVKNEELQELVSKLKEKVTDLEQKYETLEERLFSFKNIASQDSLVAFYTGFPNYQTMMALYDYLDPGDRGENISYWFVWERCRWHCQASETRKTKDLEDSGRVFSNIV